MTSPTSDHHNYQNRLEDEHLRCYAKALHGTRRNTIDKFIQQERLRAKIEELRSVCPMFTDIQLNGTNGREDNHSAREKINSRIVDLQKQLDELEKK